MWDSLQSHNLPLRLRFAASTWGWIAHSGGSNSLYGCDLAKSPLPRVKTVLWSHRLKTSVETTDRISKTAPWPLEDFFTFAWILFCHLFPIYSHLIHLIVVVIAVISWNLRLVVWVSSYICWAAGAYTFKLSPWHETKRSSSFTTCRTAVYIPVTRHHGKLITRNPCALSRCADIVEASNSLRLQDPFQLGRSQILKLVSVTSPGRKCHQLSSQTSWKSFR